MNTLKLRAVDGIDRAFYYDGLCHICGHIFIYKSHNSLLRQLLDFDFFKMEFQTHITGCVNNSFEENFDVKLNNFISNLTNNEDKRK